MNMAKKKKLEKVWESRVFELSLISGIVLLSFFFWNSFFIYPIKLFVVLTHEISHGLMAIISGGKLDSIFIGDNLSGETRTIGGNKFLIASAGYFGSLIFGAFFFISGYKEKFMRIFSVTLSVIFILFAANYLKGNFGKMTAFFFAVFFGIIPFYIPLIFNSYLYKILGLISMIYVLIDIKEDLFSTTYRPSDAEFIAQITDISAIIWGIIWMTISALVMFFVVKWGINMSASHKYESVS